MIEALRNRIAELRSSGAPLEPDSAEREQLGGAALAHALACLDQVESASSNRPWSEVFAQRLAPEFTDSGRDAALSSISRPCRPAGVATTRQVRGYIPAAARSFRLATCSKTHQKYPVCSPSRSSADEMPTHGLPKSSDIARCRRNVTSGGSIATSRQSSRARGARPRRRGGRSTRRSSQLLRRQGVHMRGAAGSAAGDRHRRMPPHERGGARGRAGGRRRGWRSPMARNCLGRHGRFRRNRSTRRDRRSVPAPRSVVPRRWRLWRPVRAVRRRQGGAARHRAGGQRRARPAQDPISALRHRRRAGSRSAALAGGV